MKRLIIFVVTAVLLSFTSASSIALAGNPPSKYYLNEALLPFDALPGTSTDRYWGVHGGAGYRIEVPENWNGALVLYCHGYRGYIPELTVTNPSIREYLVNNRFAWAASSYSTNGYDPKAGVKDTHDLAELFNGLVGKPNRTYIIGHSMGGHITGVAIEQYPKSFDGALPMCGVMGDNELFDYFFDYHVVAQWLTETDVGFPFPPDYTTVIIPQMKTELGGVTPPGFPVTLSADGVKLRTATKYFSGGERPLFNSAFVAWGNFLFTVGLDGTLGGVTPGNIMGNMDSVYQLDDILAAQSTEEILLNQEVLRIAPAPQGRHPNGLANVPNISGNISIPVLTLHTIGDLFVPFLMEQIYADRVAAQGKSDLLVQRVIRDLGHCGFTTGEQEIAFAALVNWVENGVKPAGDDVLTASVVANSKYGCQFTPVRHPASDPLPWACTSP
jgi:pimeloyl-ACP methyl ester carboxylesterase